MQIRVSVHRFPLLGFVLLLVTTAIASAQQIAGGGSPTDLYVDVSTPAPAPQPSSFRGGASVSPDGHTLGMNSRYLTRDGQPWLPAMGEFHYSRVPEAEWEEQILKMKAAGVSIVATYVFWIHHEEVEGQFDWTGARDLRRFVQLCGSHGMYVYPRIGPWAHGEARNGGYPDWLLQKTQNTRSNDPVYLSYVKNYFAQVALQLKGLMWKDGGPVIGIQLENEYGRRGPGEGEEHIRELKRIAVADGLDVPIYTVTGWDGAVIPHGDVVSVFGGYPDAPWDSALTDLPPREVYSFRFKSRVTGNMGAMGLSKEATSPADRDDFPFITAEMGGGVEDTYHRRPIIQPDDVAAMVPVMLGSGVNLYGSYMFQGGENPDGKLSTLQESQATHYPTDVPVKSYDFQAPLGEFGDERLVLRKLKVFNYFMQDFGPLLAPMEPRAPGVMPAGPEDLSVPRVAVRSNGKEGFLFFNNYVRGAAMPVRKRFQVNVKFARETVTIPEQPIDLPSGAYGIWPINLKLGTAELKYATAQLFTMTSNLKSRTYYFIETPGIPAEFVWKDGKNVTLLAPGGTGTIGSTRTIFRGLRPSLDPVITIREPNGIAINIVLLSEREAEEGWKVQIGNEEHLIITRSEFFATAHQAVLQSEGDPVFQFRVIPRLSATLGGSALLKASDEKSATIYAATLHPESPQFSCKQITVQGQVPPIRLGPPVAWRPQGVAVAPGEDDFKNAARWQIKLAPQAWDGVDDLFLDVKYDGDVARLLSGGKLLTDNFYNGEPWQIGLKRFRQQIAQGGLELQILARRTDAPIFLEPAFRGSHGTSQVLALRGISLLPKYRLALNIQDVKERR